MIPGQSDSITFTGTHVVTQDDIDNGTFVNIATASGFAPDNSEPTDSDDDTQMFIQTPSMVIAKDQTSGPNPVSAAGQVIGYTIVVSNTGNITLNNVVAQDILPDGSTGVLAGPFESVSSNGELNVGENWIYVINYTATQSDIDLGIHW